MKHYIPILAFAFLTSSAYAQSDCIDLKYISPGAGNNVQISTTSGSTFQNVFGGVLNMKVNNDQIFGMFCVDPFVTMATSTYCTTQLTTSAMGSVGSQVAYLVNKYLPQINSETNSTLKKDKGMALQVTLWELVAETSSALSVSGGSFQAKASSGSFSGQQQSLISAYLNDIGSGTATYFKAELGSNQVPVSQSMVTPVPEPASICALLIGAGAILRRRRKE